VRLKVLQLGTRPPFTGWHSENRSSRRAETASSVSGWRMRGFYWVGRGMGTVSLDIPLQFFRK